MARLVLLAAFATVAWADVAPELEGTERALAMDDACLADPSSEECSVSLRQLRGKKTMAAVGRHSGLEEKQNKTRKGGFCCYDGTNKDNICGTCLPRAKAAEDDFCAAADHCGGCGGTWCMAVCVFSSEDPSDPCGTAFDGGIAEADSLCAGSESKCTGCNGHWCGAMKAKLPTVTESTTPWVPEVPIFEEPTMPPAEAPENMSNTSATATGPAEPGAAPEWSPPMPDLPPMGDYDDDDDDEAAATSEKPAAATTEAPAAAATEAPAAATTEAPAAATTEAPAAATTEAPATPEALMQKHDDDDVDDDDDGMYDDDVVHEAALVQKHNSSRTPEGGFCCFSGSDSSNICGTCFPKAMAAEDNYCASSDQCGGCGGTWCRAVCVFSSEDPSDPCGTAYEGGIAEDKSYCAGSESRCTGCNGHWCGVMEAKIPKADVESTTPWVPEVPTFEEPTMPPAEETPVDPIPSAPVSPDSGAPPEEVLPALPPMPGDLDEEDADKPAAATTETPAADTAEGDSDGMPAPETA